MVKFFLIVLLQIVFVSRSFAWMDVYTYNDFYKYDVEPKIDAFCKNVLSKAEDIISFEQPLLKVHLTQSERYFSKESMEFFGIPDDGKPITAQYSSVIWIGVWCDGKTLVKGWAKEDQKFHVDYIYTIDPQIVFMGGIHVDVDTTTVQKFFGANVYDISVKLGVIRYPFLGNDDFTIPVLELFYNQYKVECIEVWYDVVMDDVVPVVPRVSRVNDFVDRKIKELSGVRRQENQSVVTSSIYLETESKQTQTNLSSTAIIILFLVGGIIISFVIWGLIEFVSYIMTEPDAPLSTEKVMHEAEVIDAEFTDVPESDDYDYPYEDISQVLRGRQ